MNIKAVFCDVDGTLLNDQQEILSSTKLAIQNLQKNNIKFVLVSGRCPAGIYSVTQDSLDKCTVISHNGAIILDENKKILYEKGITHQKASEIIKSIFMYPGIYILLMIGSLLIAMIRKFNMRKKCSKLFQKKVK